MNKIYLSIIATLLSWLCCNAQCITNGNFEGGLPAFPGQYTFTTLNPPGTTYSYTDCHIDTQTASFINLTPSTTINNIVVGGVPQEGVTLVSNAPIAPYGVNDPTLYNNNTTGATVSLPRVNPSGGGNFAIKLNGNIGNSNITTMSRSFIAASSVISFDFSLIFQLHGEDDVEPFFTARVYNTAGEIINENEICYKANVDNNIFNQISINGLTLYTGWQCGLINIPDSYIGQNVRLEFVVADCGATGHFGTAYLDNIRCDAVCSNPVFGILSLNQVNVTCPSAPFQICGSFVAPLNSAIVPSSLKLDLYDLNDNLITNIAAVPTITGSNFCFTVEPNQITQYNGNFEFRANANFLKPASSGSPAYTYNLFDSSASEGADITLNAISTQEATIANAVLSWPDIGDTYDLQFVADNSCCPGRGEISDKYYSATVTDNHFDLWVAVNAIAAKCFRWRIKSNCGGWSDWCCLSGAEQYGFPEAFGNPIAPKCYLGDLDCQETLYTDVNLPNPDGEYYSFEQRDVSITAVNILASQTEAVYEAGEFVILSTGFNAQTGSFLLAEIENCTPAQNIVQQKSRRYVEREYLNSISNVQNENGEEITVYPNPTSGILNIAGSYANTVYHISDVSGKEIMHFNNSGNREFSVDISKLGSGIYFLSAEGIQTQKIIKN